MIAAPSRGWRGATKAHNAGMQPRSNEASRDASAVSAIDLGHSTA